MMVVKGSLEMLESILPAETKEREMTARGWQAVNEVRIRVLLPAGEK